MMLCRWLRVVPAGPPLRHFPRDAVRRVQDVQGGGGGGERGGGFAGQEQGGQDLGDRGQVAARVLRVHGLHAGAVRARLLRNLAGAAHKRLQTIFLSLDCFVTPNGAV